MDALEERGKRNIFGDGPFGRILGWTAVGLSTVISCFWAFWGSIENFHEGWYYRSLLSNLLLMLGQYLLPMLLFMGAALIALRLPSIGGGLHITAAVAASWFFGGRHPWVIFPYIVAPLAFIGAAYWLGRPRPLKRAVIIVTALPLAVMLICGAGPAYRVSQRSDDGNLAARRISGNGVDLIWAPEGPGWPQKGVSWHEALRLSRHLTEDGRSLADTPQDIWRLPTVEEAVRSMHLHGRNCGGTWDPSSGKAKFDLEPDKETPLWNVHSQVIYWWTATELDGKEAYMVVYNGGVHKRSKQSCQGYLGFRAVKQGTPIVK